VLNPNDKDVLREIKNLTGSVGVDFGFEDIGSGAVMAQAYKATREGGTVTVVGVAKPEDTFSVDAQSLTLNAKTIKGSLYGSANPPSDFPMLLNLYRMGKLNLNDMITQRYKIDDAKRAFADLRAKTNARGVIIFE
jgi:S-(hydroxymethyl)glutathione dehydrogenase / alcohol dehydrogenase